MLCKFTFVLIVLHNCKFAKHDLLLCLASPLTGCPNTCMKNVFLPFCHDLHLLCITYRAGHKISSNDRVGPLEPYVSRNHFIRPQLPYTGLLTYRITFRVRGFIYTTTQCSNTTYQSKITRKSNPICAVP